MKWFLIITTFYSPHVPLVINEVEMPSGQICHEMLRKFDDRWNGKADPNFHFNMRCEQRKTPQR